MGGKSVIREGRLLFRMICVSAKLSKRTTKIMKTKTNYEEHMPKIGDEEGVLRYEPF